jgi:hypothetical protein
LRQLADRGIRVGAGVVANDEHLAVVGLGAGAVLDVLDGVADRDLEAVADLQVLDRSGQLVPEQEADHAGSHEQEHEPEPDDAHCASPPSGMRRRPVDAPWAAV